MEKSRTGQFVLYAIPRNIQVMVLAKITMYENKLHEVLTASIDKGFSTKEALSEILNYAQYHNEFKNIFSLYKNKFIEQEITEQRHQELERILAVV